MQFQQILSQKLKQQNSKQKQKQSRLSPKDSKFFLLSANELSESKSPKKVRNQQSINTLPYKTTLRKQCTLSQEQQQYLKLILNWKEGEK